MRGPFDIVNICTVLKLKDAEAFDTISKNCELLLKHAKTRRLKSSQMEVVSKKRLLEKFQHICSNSKIKENKIDKNSTISISNDARAETDSNDESSEADVTEESDTEETRTTGNKRKKIYHQESETSEDFIKL